MQVRVISVAVAIALLASIMWAESGSARRRRRDRKPPVATISTKFAPAPLNFASTFLGILNNVPGVAVPRKTEGTATDDVSGIKSVTVTWTPCGDPHPAGQACVAYPQRAPQNAGGAVVVKCTDSRRRSCVWESTLPVAPGFYQLSVYATDMKNKRSAIRSVRMFVAA